jgi:hypothetical protein
MVVRGAPIGTLEPAGFRVALLLVGVPRLDLLRTEVVAVKLRPRKLATLEGRALHSHLN